MKRLASPACPTAIRDAEKKLGIKFPKDLKDSLKCHNGTKRDSKFVVFDLLSISQIVKKTLTQRKSAKEMDEEFGESDFLDGGWNESAIVIGDSGAGWYFTLDCSNGKVYIYQAASYALELAESLADYLDGLADNIRHENYEVEDSRIWMPEWGERV